VVPLSSDVDGSSPQTQSKVSTAPTQDERGGPPPIPASATRHPGGGRRLSSDASRVAVPVGVPLRLEVRKEVGSATSRSMRGEGGLLRRSSEVRPHARQQRRRRSAATVVSGQGGARAAGAMTPRPSRGVPRVADTRFEAARRRHAVPSVTTSTVTSERGPPASSEWFVLKYKYWTSVTSVLPSPQVVHYQLYFGPWGLFYLQAFDEATHPKGRFEEELWKEAVGLSACPC